MNNCITNFIGIKGIFIESIEEIGNRINILASTNPVYPNCPCCRKKTKRIHDYRIQDIRDLPYRNKQVHILLKKRRYRCECGKRFFEKYSFLPKYHHLTQRVYENIIREFRKPVTFKQVAERYGVSINTVVRICDLLSYKLYKLPEVIAIDEFKGNSGGEKYQCILTNPSNQKILDILPTREKHYLIDYVRNYKRENVSIFIMDMWETYKDIAKTFFPNAMIVVDKYHYIRQVYWAMHNVRKRVQESLSSLERLYFKKHKTILDKREGSLKPYQRVILNRMLQHNEDLYNAWQLKEIFYDFRDEINPQKAETKLREFINTAEEIGLAEFQPAITAFTNWFEYIINSKRTKYTNAFTEGTNNKIKVLKRIGYGYRNYPRFRNRILHLC